MNLKEEDIQHRVLLQYDVYVTMCIQSEVEDQFLYYSFSKCSTLDIFEGDEIYYSRREWARDDHINDYYGVLKSKQEFDMFCMLHPECEEGLRIYYPEFV